LSYRRDLRFELSVTAKPRLRFPSLSSKLALSVVLVVALAGLFAARTLGRAARDQLISAKASAASMLCALFAESVAPAVDFADPDSIRIELTHLQSNRDITYAAVWGRAGDSPLAELYPNARPGKRPGMQPRLSFTPDHIEIVRPLQDPHGANIGTLIAVFSLAPENARMAETRSQIVTYAEFLGLGISLVIFLVMRVQAIRPLHRLVEAAEALGAGSVREVSVSSNDEIGRLATSFNSMARRIQDREKNLAARNRELKQLLDNMRQAIVVFGPDGNLSGFRSHQADALFPSQDLDRCSLLSLLYPDVTESVEAKAFLAWQELAFEASPEDWSQALELAPSKVTLERGTERERLLALEFIPLLEGDAVRHVMLLATDLTDQVRLERMVKLKDEEHTRKLAAMRRLLAGGGHLLVAMLDASQARVTRCVELLRGDLEANTIEALFGQIHTVKGEARAFDLSELDAAANFLEDYLALLRSRLRRHDLPPAGNDLAILHERLSSVERAIAAARTLLVEASPIGAAIVEQVTVRRSDLDRLVALAGKPSTEIGRAVERLTARPFGEALLYLSEAVPSWAERYGKQVVLEVSGRDVGIPLRLARLLPPTLTHLARNAVAHGIETPLDREHAGKAPRGLLHVAARETPEGLEVTFADDGRGLDGTKILDQARSLGLSGAPEELIFAPGLSTSGETLLSGRGVGLSAARDDLVAAGYALELMPAERGTHFRIVALTGK
jgi:two-component system chemotaxis sensor kinase CheA